MGCGVMLLRGWLAAMLWGAAVFVTDALAPEPVHAWAVLVVAVGAGVLLGRELWRSRSSRGLSQQ